MRTLRGGWGRYEYGITGKRRGEMKRAMARRRRYSERRAAREVETDDLILIETNRQTGQRWHWSRDAMW